MTEEQNVDVHAALLAAQEASVELNASIEKEPEKHRMLTGDRPTGALHIGHLFGSLQNRVRLQNQGVESFVVIADYQVLTDRSSADGISNNVRELVLDYLAAGLKPDGDGTYIFPHSHVPALNQLLLPFLTLVSMAELGRNPTIKEEIQAAGLKTVNASMFVYPVHQAADILFCNATVVPVGKDQLPHLEISRKIARRFNQAYPGKGPTFRMPHALLSESVMIRGLDGTSKMSKSRNNAVFLRNTEKETTKLLKRAKTDADRNITYDPVKRPEIANLLDIYTLVTGESQQDIAADIGDAGAGTLKLGLAKALNEYLAPMRERRVELENTPGLVEETLRLGVAKANEVARETLNRVLSAMDMAYQIEE